MIKPEELRIGNLVKTSNKSLNYAEVATVQKIEPEVIFLVELWAGEYPSGIEGIELTPEWLKRAGFKKVGPEDKYALEYDGRVIIGYWPIDGAINVGQFTDSNIKHVHQLQNLYYALTGSELTFKDL